MTFVYIFIVSFVTNLIWENAHAPLYTHHLNEKITESTLLVASLGDAVIITLFAILFSNFSFLKERIWLIIPVGIIIAIFIELYALGVNRWAYNEYMPIIPMLDIGVTPTIQLGLLGYIIFKFFL